MIGFSDANIVAIRPDGIYWRTPYDPEVVRQECRTGKLYIPDGRDLSDQQRRNIWAMIGEIASHSGYKGAQEKKQLNNAMKKDFLLAFFDRLTAAAIGDFSIGNVDMTTAAMYQEFLINVILENNIPTRQPILEYSDDIQKTVYACLMHKKCIICGSKCDLHHVDRVGMGNNRDDICHIGMECLPLCREHHMEAHQHGDRALMDKYHLEPVTIDEKIAKLYRLGRRKANE
jgi:hypothetical protein